MSLSRFSFSLCLSLYLCVCVYVRLCLCLCARLCLSVPLSLFLSLRSPPPRVGVSAFVCLCLSPTRAAAFGVGLACKLKHEHRLMLLDHAASMPAPLGNVQVPTPACGSAPPGHKGAEGARPTRRQSKSGSIPTKSVVTVILLASPHAPIRITTRTVTHYHTRGRGACGEATETDLTATRETSLKGCATCAIIRGWRSSRFRLPIRTYDALSLNTGRVCR